MVFGFYDIYNVVDSDLVTVSSSVAYLCLGITNKSDDDLLNFKLVLAAKKLILTHVDNIKIQLFLSKTRGQI